MVPEDNSSARIAGQFFEELHPEIRANERIELRFKRPGPGEPMLRRFVQNVGEAAALAVSLGGAHDVYFGVGIRRGQDGTKAGVCRLEAVWADLDAKDGHTRDGRLGQLMALPCRPSMLVWTGAGWHAYWLLIRPAESPQEMELAELVMRRLAVGLGSDPVSDRSRILRVPGTHNFKRDEPRPVVLEHLAPDRRYTLDQHRAMAEGLPNTIGAAGATGETGETSREILGKPVREGKRNVALASVAGSLRDRGLDVETIGVVLLGVNRARCSPPLGDEEVLGIARSMGRYPAGRPRYRRSPVTRIHRKKKER